MSRSRTRRDRDTLRTARRDALLVLLSRAQRGVLSRPEGEQLRQHVETELTLADQTRASAGGQQAAMQRMQRQLDAAHAEIRAQEQRAAEADIRADRYAAAWRNAHRRAREHAAEEQRIRGWCGHWAQHYREAREQLDRTQAAWRSARRRAAAKAAALTMTSARMAHAVAQAARQAVELSDAQRAAEQNRGACCDCDHEMEQ